VKVIVLVRELGHHQKYLWRAKDALNTLDTRSAERRELLGEIHPQERVGVSISFAIFARTNKSI
jgi:hypothetical protein